MKKVKKAIKIVSCKLGFHDWASRFLQDEQPLKSIGEMKVEDIDNYIRPYCSICEKTMNLPSRKAMIRTTKLFICISSTLLIWGVSQIYKGSYWFGGYNVLINGAGIFLHARNYIKQHRKEKKSIIETIPANEETE